jgi:OOP family OmpA-OmpF porin
MMKANFLSKLLVSLFLLSGQQVYAENNSESAWYLLPGASYTNTDSEVKSDNGMGGFIKLGKQINPSWDIQLGANYSEFDERVANVSGGNYKSTQISFDTLYMLSRENLRPFLLVGLGFARNDLDYANQWGASKNSVMANVGFGAQYFFNERFGLQADLREVWSRAEVGPINDRDNQIIGNTVFNLAVIFNLDAPAKASPVAINPTPEVASAESVATPVTPPEATTDAPPVQQAAPKCKPRSEKITIQAETMFDFDKAVIKPEGKKVLDELLPTLKNHDDIEMILVTGHTDRIGSDAYNLALSKRRAEAVSQYLINNGVERNHIKAVGKGKSEPEVECSGIRGKKLIECLAPNRRVEIDASHVQEAGCE